MTIARIWHGITLTTDADRYLRYLDQSVIPSYQIAEGNEGLLSAGSPEMVSDGLFMIPLSFKLKDLEREFSINISIRVEELLPPKAEEVPSEIKKEEEKVELSPLTAEEFEEERLVEEWLKEEGTPPIQNEDDDISIEVEEEKEN